jgi:hypothetical protein
MGLALSFRIWLCDALEGQVEDLTYPEIASERWSSGRFVGCGPLIAARRTAARSPEGGVRRQAFAATISPSATIVPANRKLSKTTNRSATSAGPNLANLNAKRRLGERSPFPDALIRVDALQQRLHPLTPHSQLAAGPPPGARSHGYSTPETQTREAHSGVESCSHTQRRC